MLFDHRDVESFAALLVLCLASQAEILFFKPAFGLKLLPAHTIKQTNTHPPTTGAQCVLSSGEYFSQINTANLLTAFKKYLLRHFLSQRAPSL